MVATMTIYRGDDKSWDLTFTDSAGETSCTGTITTSDLGDPGDGNKFWMNSTCIINIE